MYIPCVLLVTAVKATRNIRGLRGSRMLGTWYMLWRYGGVLELCVSFRIPNIDTWYTRHILSRTVIAEDPNRDVRLCSVASDRRKSKAWGT